MEYTDFLSSKFRIVEPAGFEANVDAGYLAPFQRDLVGWATRRGRAALFCDTGLGKTRMELEWARLISDGECSTRVLILAPLAVAAQTVREGERIGIPVTLCRDASDVRDGINITNYDRLHRFDPSAFIGVALDESSCIKHYDSKTLAQLLAAFGESKYRLCATATPAPNDYTELGTHAEFLGICSRVEMLSEFFVHDSGETQTWRLKGHARDQFWRWVASWAALVRRPSDLGYSDEGYILPALTIHRHVVEADQAEAFARGMLFVEEARTLNERRDARRASIPKRVAMCAEIVGREPDDQWLIWGDLNAETEAITQAIPGAVEVRGPDDRDEKERRVLDFAEGRIRVLVSKSSICGYGLNLQNCARQAFVGVSDSFEDQYQTIRRSWRFGQRRPVDVHMFASEAERLVLENIDRKRRDAEAMADSLAKMTGVYVRENVTGHGRRHNEYAPAKPMKLPRWLRSA